MSLQTEKSESAEYEDLRLARFSSAEESSKVAESASSCRDEGAKVRRGMVAGLR